MLSEWLNSLVPSAGTTHEQREEKREQRREQERLVLVPSDWKTRCSVLTSAPRRQLYMIQLQRQKVSDLRVSVSSRSCTDCLTSFRNTWSAADKCRLKWAMVGPCTLLQLTLTVEEATAAWEEVWVWDYVSLGLILSEKASSLIPADSIAAVETALMGGVSSAISFDPAFACFLTLVLLGLLFWMTAWCWYASGRVSALCPHALRSWTILQVPKLTMHAMLILQCYGLVVFTLIRFLLRLRALTHHPTCASHRRRLWRRFRRRRRRLLMLEVRNDQCTCIQQLNCTSRCLCLRLNLTLCLFILTAVDSTLLCLASRFVLL